MSYETGRVISLYSPILPMMTGTADYFQHVLETFRRRGLPATQVRIVIDSDMLPKTQRPTHVLGYRLVDFRSVSNVVDGNETRIFFVANNEFHAYIHYAVARAEKLAGGRVISVVHDVCCAMLLKHLSFNGFFGFSPSLYAEINRAQFGPSTQKVIDDRMAGNLSEVFEYVTHSQGAALARSDEIWTHSRFGALKLMLESDIPRDKLPRFRYAIHPRYDDGASTVAQSANLAAEEAKKPGVFRFGVFGWASPSKRLYEALNGLRLMLARLPHADREKIEFVIVGKLPPPDYYDPVGHARSIGVIDRCRFFGFVDAQKFRALMNDCDCVLNLRYPSCGESSGVSAHAHGSGASLFMSACQAFNEEDAAVHIEPLAPLEEFALASAMTRLFLARRDGEDEAITLPAPSKNAHLASMDELLAVESWSDIAMEMSRRLGGARLRRPKEGISHAKSFAAEPRQFSEESSNI